jgi:hypothetical protein
MTDGERASRRAGVRREHEPARLIEPSQKHTCRRLLSSEQAVPIKALKTTAPKSCFIRIVAPSV